MSATRRLSPFAAVLPMLLSVAVALSAQEGTPEEPELVLPSFVLTVEDVSVERIEAGIPGESDLLPPERTAPLPQAGELRIQEPDLALQPPTGDEDSELITGRAFFVEGQVGAGTLHQLVSEITIYRPPELKLAATYDMRDGLAGQPAGSGFHRKTAGLVGRLAVGSDPFHLTVDGSFTDEDIGLQGQSVYGSRVLRRTHLEADGTWQLRDNLGLGASLSAGATTLLFTRDTPLVATGYELSPSLRAELGVGPFRAALDLVYTLVVDSGEPPTSGHRFSPALTVGLDLPLALTAEAEVGWHWSVGGPHLVPFRIELTGTPLDPLWLRLAGGYRVVDQDRAAAMRRLPLSLPAGALPDERGWYGEGEVRVSVLKTLILSGGVSFSLRSDAVSLAADADSSGLYPVELLDLTQLGGTAGILWDIVPGLTTRLVYQRQFLDRRRFEPTDSVALTADATLASGRVGLGLSARFDLVPEIGAQVPRVDLDGSVRLNPNVRMVAEATDLLAPLTGSPRAGIGSYLEPGFGASIRLLVSL